MKNYYKHIKNRLLIHRRERRDSKAMERYRSQVIPQVAADRYEYLHDITARIGIDRMRDILNESEKAGDKYITLAHLLAEATKRT